MRNITRCASAFVAAILLAITSSASSEEAWPQRSVTIVVPFQAGGSADLLARILQQHMEADFHSPFVVENRSGAGGSVGTAYVAKAPNDGYTFLLGTLSGNVLNEFVFSKLSYDPERDFQPVSLLVHLPNLLVVNQKVPVKTVPELIAYLKANDGKLELRLLRHRHLVAAVRGDVRTRHRHAYDARAVPQHDRRIDRHDERQCRSRHRQHDHAVAAGAGRCGAGAGGDQRGTPRQRARPADHRRDHQGLSRLRAGRACSRPPARRARSWKNSQPK